MSRTIRIFVAVFLLGVPWILNAQLRSDLLESARNERKRPDARDARPKRKRKHRPGAESLAVQASDRRSERASAWVRVPSCLVAGFAMGPKYQAHRSAARPAGISGKLAPPSNESYFGRMELSLPHLLDDRGSLDFTVLHRNISEMSYYGPGPDSEKTGAATTGWRTPTSSSAPPIVRSKSCGRG